MTLKINQSVSKDAQARTLLKELLKVHQIHQAYNVRDLTDADEQILEKAFNTTREMMPRISEGNQVWRQEVGFIIQLLDGWTNLICTCAY